MKTRLAVIGPVNIGTDLMIKLIRLLAVLDMAVMAGKRPGFRRSRQPRRGGRGQRSAGLPQHDARHAGMLLRQPRG
jgi:acetaldehyde dehydrogenase (acetylating)